MDVGVTLAVDGLVGALLADAGCASVFEVDGVDGWVYENAGWVLGDCEMRGVASGFGLGFLVTGTVVARRTYWSANCRDSEQRWRRDGEGVLEIQVVSQVMLMSTIRGSSTASFQILLRSLGEGVSHVSFKTVWGWGKNISAGDGY